MVPRSLSPTQSRGQGPDGMGSIDLRLDLERTPGFSIPEDDPDENFFETLEGIRRLMGKSAGA